MTITQPSSRSGKRMTLLLSLLLVYCAVSCTGQTVGFDFRTAEGEGHPLIVLSAGSLSEQPNPGENTKPSDPASGPVVDIAGLGDDKILVSLMESDLTQGGKTAVEGHKIGLSTPYTIDRSGLSFRTEIRTNANLVRAEFFSAQEETPTRVMYATARPHSVNETVPLYFPLPSGFVLSAFRLSGLAENSRALFLHIESTKLDPTPQQITPDSGRVSGFFVAHGPNSISVRTGALYPERIEPTREYYLQFEYTLPTLSETLGANGGDLVSLTASGPGKKEFRWDLRVRPGTHSIYLHQAFTGFLPNEFTIGKTVPGLVVRSVKYGSIDFRSDLSLDGGKSLPAGDFKAPEPIPADLGTILRFPQAFWRQKDFEVFSWSLFPRILLIDFADVDIQDRFVKRLAFFVEKRNFRGTLMTNMQLRDKHGWNANNYNPDGLAAFFNTAVQTGFLLNDEEVLLRELSIKWGVLRYEGGSYQPGVGGVLSVARGAGMSHVTRTVLIQHESLHGAFYELPVFQKQSYDEFDNLPATAKSFLVRFFEFMAYDSADRYLMVNETQAYLLQQSLNGLTNYITVRIPQRIAQVYPDQLQAYTRAANAALPGLAAAAKRLSDTLYTESGVRIGLMECLLPRNSFDE